MEYGYARVSSYDQNEERQAQALQKNRDKENEIEEISPLAG